MSDSKENGTTGNIETFVGFYPPEQNFFSLPNEWTQITSKITTLGELRVVEYVLRHTWGFGEYDKPKRITIDEFMLGRKRRDKTRMDSGISMSRQAVVTGVRNAVEHGYLVVTQKSCLGGKQNLYHLKMNVPPTHSGSLDVRPLRNLEEIKWSNIETAESESGLTSRHSTEEKTSLERNPLSEQKSPDDTYSSKNLKHVSSGAKKNEMPEISKNGKKRKKTEATGFDIKCEKVLVKIIEQVETIQKNSKVGTWRHNFRLLRQMDGVSKKEIKEALIWYKDHIGEDFIPEAFCGAAFRSKYPRLRRAMKKTASPPKKEYHNKEEESYCKATKTWYNRDLIDKFRSKYYQQHSGVSIEQDKLDEILVENGLKPGELPATAVHSG